MICLLQLQMANAAVECLNAFSKPIKSPDPHVLQAQSVLVSISLTIVSRRSLSSWHASVTTHITYDCTG